ncbi:MAG: IS110 family transposase [Candidatus Aerophobetes bacterium]|nr:IS110 family transposase [Candidatus Aerophobetes bacterium]
MYYIGIDISKKSFTVSVLDEEGEAITKPFTYSCNREGMEKFVSKISSLKLEKDKVVIGIEATGNLWENLYSFLKGYKVIILNPYQTKKYHQILSKKAKTDKVDSLVIAGLLRSKEALASYIPEDEVQVLRELVRLRHHLKKDKKNYLRKAYSLLNLVFPEYINLIKDPFKKVSSMILKEYPTAVHMKRAKKTKLVKMARKIQGNNYSSELAEKLISLAKESIYSGKASEVRGIALRILIDQIHSFEDKIKEINEKIDEILSFNEPSSPQKRLLSIPGVGPKTVAAFLGEVGDDVSRFSSANKLIGFIGWHPKISESGDSKNPHPKMSKRGPSALRASLYMAAVASLKHNPYLRSLYHRKISEGKESKQALVCVGKKIICIMYSMLKYEVDYDPQRIFFQFEKEQVLT